MKKNEAEKLVNETFTGKYDENKFRGLVQHLFLKYDPLDENASSGKYIPESFHAHILSFKRIAKFLDPERREIDVLAVKLKNRRILENARTMQRNFIARYLNGGRGGQLKDAALVAFYSDDSEDWRFSLIKMDYVLDEAQKKIKKELTPARRYSFLVGKNEKTHTVRKQLVPIFISETETTLNELERAFNIETVTKEFFEKYKALYLRLKEALDAHLEKDSIVKNEFDSKDVKTSDFAKRLLGQIVFLYFLQKKGWLGVTKGQHWGTGPKDFLQRLYRLEQNPNRNFFNDVLEPLFYEALATERADNFYQQFNCKIPFLNGGLFEPIRGYDWVNTDILLENAIFEEIFDVFDLYNFTVREDEPLDKEVAVDPEMLGKVFENLIPENERKGSGTYYTPREIVHYMCQESLINFIESKVDQNLVPRKDIESLVHHGDIAIENELTAQEKHKNENYGGDYHYKIPESIRSHSKQIDDALAHIKICDPAIGSGAFPVGMMNEIVRARYSLTPFMDNANRTLYDFKRHAIQESIYGVDIESSAVDIAKLRLWLSLVVDEDDFATIKPLPNLEYKIRVGNSLLSTKDSSATETLPMFNTNLEDLKRQYFSETSPSKKHALKEAIDSLIQSWTGQSETFDFEIYFSEVFRENGGFDVVIGNPPYVRHEGIKDLKPQLKKTFGQFFCGTADLYTYFYKRGIEILKPGAHLCYIAPNKFMRAGYGKNTRNLFTSEITPKVVLDFGDLPIFDATTYPSILMLEKRKPALSHNVLTATFTQPDQLLDLRNTIDSVGFPLAISALSPEGWALQRPDVLRLMEKLKKSGVPLGEYVQGKFYRGVLTGFNDAFVIDEETKKKLIEADPKSEELIKPWLRGRDIQRWKAAWAGLYVIFTRRGTDIESYPAIKAHLSQFRADLEPKKSDKDKQGRKPGSYKWFEIQDNIAYYEAFEGAKIVYPNITKTNIFAFDSSGFYANQKCFIIPTNDLYLLGILNSKLGRSWFIHTLPLLRGGFFEPSSIFMQNFPVYSASEEQKKRVFELVQEILSNPTSPNVSNLESQINQLVYKLYELTDEEIAIVEGKNG